MSISGALHNALSGLKASSRQAAAVSSNISNATTKGYGQRSVNLSASHYGSGGVNIDSIERIYDSKILAARRLADSELHFMKRTSVSISTIYRGMGKVDDLSNLSAQFTALEKSIVTAQSDPSSTIRLNAVVDRMKDVSNRINQDAETLKNQREVADQSIAKDIDTLNESLSQIEKINNSIRRAYSQGVDVSSMVDARQNLIDKVATIVPVKELTRENGSVALITTHGQTLVDGRASQFSFSATPSIAESMSFANDNLSGIALNNNPLSKQNGYGNLKGGSLEAAFKLRDQTIPSLQLKLDRLAFGVLAAFKQSHIDPTISTPDKAGYFADSSTNGGVTGLARRLQINSSIDPSQGGDVSKLRSGLHATGSVPLGTSAQLERLHGAFSIRSSIEGSEEVKSISDHIIDYHSNVGSLKLRHDEKVSFEQSRRDTLYQSELSKGVDSDHEMQNLLQIQKHYAANAKVIQIAKSMLQRLMEI